MAKKNPPFTLEELRQRFRLTPIETRVGVFVVAAFTLGVITKSYRDAHPAFPSAQDQPRKTAASEHWAKAMQADAPNAGQPKNRKRKSVQKLNLSDSAMER